MMLNKAQFDALASIAVEARAVLAALDRPALASSVTQRFFMAARGLRATANSLTAVVAAIADSNSKDTPT